MEAFTHGLDNGELHLILMPTEACNFRCTYCYESFGLKRMRPGVVRGVKRLLAVRAPELHTLWLSWFGGEPLLAQDTIEELLVHARDLRQRWPRLKLYSDITTNAYLLDRPTFTRLLELGVTRYQITFDGPAEWHDRKRVLANGRGTFDRIWNNLLATRGASGDFLITVRLHADAENHRALPGFLDTYERYFGQDSRYRLFVRKLARFGGPNDAALPILEGTSARRILRELERRSDEQNGHEQRPRSPEICYAAKANSLLVRADGRLNKCSVALEHPGNQVGRILEDGRVQLDAAKVGRWMRGLWSAHLGDLACPLQRLEC